MVSPGTALETRVTMLFAYNTSFVTAVGESPYFLLYGRDPRLPVDVLFNTPELQYEPLTDYARALIERL